MSARGFSLLEVLLALGLLGVVLVVVIPAFFAFLEANSQNEVRSGAMATAQQVMEALREEDPAALPSSGASPIQLVNVGGREYDAVTRYCVEAAYCDSTTRHLLVEVSFGGNVIYTVESIFTQLQ